MDLCWSLVLAKKPDSAGKNKYVEEERKKIVPFHSSPPLRTKLAKIYTEAKMLCVCSLKISINLPFFLKTRVEMWRRDTSRERYGGIFDPKWDHGILKWDRSHIGLTVPVRFNSRQTAFQSRSFLVKLRCRAIVKSYITASIPYPCRRQGRGGRGQNQQSSR